jgi:type VII secretion protein EccE
MWRLGLRPGGVSLWAGVAIVGGAAALLASPFLIQWRGRPAHHWLAVWWRFRRRRAAARRSAPLDAVGPLAGLVDLPSVRVITDRDDRKIGALFAESVWSVVLLADDDESVVTRGSATALPLEVLATVLQEREIRLSTIRVIRHATPAAFGTAGWSRVGMWVVLTLDPAQNRPAVEGRGGGSVGAQRALASVAARVAARSVTGGVRLRVLDPAEIRAVPAVLLPGHTSDQPLAAQETWRDWTFGDGTCVGLRVRRWPDLERIGELLDAMSGAGARAVTSLVALGHGRSAEVAIDGLFRMTFDSPAAAAAGVTRGVEIAHAAGGQLEPMNGEHGLAIPATIPGMWR